MDESIEIIESEDGKSFTVVDTGLPAPTNYTYSTEPLSKNDKIGLSLLGAGFAAVIGTIGWFTYKEDKKVKVETAARTAEMKRKREERQEWFDTQRREGRTVIETMDGEYMSIPNEAYQAAEFRKKAV